jgi:superfamily II DNA/RNA helicase
MLTKNFTNDSGNPQFKSCLLIGGLEIREQRKSLLMQRPSILFATLGRLTDLLDKEYINLNSLKVLAIDEADRFKVVADTAGKKFKVQA